jgi:hypothetical protein
LWEVGVTRNQESHPVDEAGPVLQTLGQRLQT